MHIVISIILALIVLWGIGILFQWMGSRGYLFAQPAANEYGLVVSRGSDDSDGTPGGKLLDVIHAIPGVKLNKNDPDPFNWFFEPGEEDHDWLFENFGIVWLGPFKGLRTLVVRNIRFGRGDDETEYHMMPKGGPTKWAHHSAQHDIEIKASETKGVLALDMKVNLSYEDKFPVRSRLKPADPTALLTIKARKRVIAVSSKIPPKDFLSGDQSEVSKAAVSAGVMEIKPEILTQIGFDLLSVDLFDITMDDATRKSLEQEEKAKLEMEAELVKADQRIEIEDRNAKAEVKKAEGRKAAKILDNDAEADHVQRVIIPMAADERTVRIREAEAYENNETVTTFAPGKDVGIMTK